MIVRSTRGAKKESGSIPEHENKTYDDRKQGYYIIGKINPWVLVVKIRDNQGEYCDRQNRTNYWPYNLKKWSIAMYIFRVQAHVHYPLNGRFNFRIDHNRPWYVE